MFLLLLLLSHFSRVRLGVTPETAAHQSPPFLGFSRHEPSNWESRQIRLSHPCCSQCLPHGVTMEKVAPLLASLWSTLVCGLRSLCGLVHRVATVLLLPGSAEGARMWSFPACSP